MTKPKHPRGRKNSEVIFEDDCPEFVNLGRASALLGVPKSWLKRQALKGEVPALQVGRRLMFNVEAVRETLLDRADRERKEVAS